MLYYIDSGYYFAGFIVAEGTGNVIDAAPIIRWLIGRKLNWVEQYCKRKGFKLQWLR